MVRQRRRADAGQAERLDHGTIGEQAQTMDDRATEPDPGGGTAAAPTLETVAAAAGVSRSTASRVINNSPKVSPEARALKTPPGSRRTW
jgi:hypothetical protein